MTKEKILNHSAVYRLLEFQTTVLTAVFGVLSIVCGLLPAISNFLSAIFGILAAVFGLMINRYSNLKSKSEENEKKILMREMKWTDIHSNVADIRFSCYNESEDLGFLLMTAKIIKKAGGKGFDIDSINLFSREEGLYLPEGDYSIEFLTRQYENAKIDIYINDKNIGERLWFDLKLKPKKE
ncbi:hypothetical protein [Flavobacterium aciduliphilum]|uniref:Uncharacterized protein n=1 Tax=Flavobacterium aciduliphilum TaxID=1101402 RepID=A0A328YQG5_9FLAO|nr:hypothetical protein [Flavobacterium aciduliphilum]RAR75604.1 hypothetical protein CLV55_101304 [Flavobacterium aciduliphilum]